MTFDFAECLTHSARMVAPRIVAQQLACTFDLEVVTLRVHGDADPVVRCLHRLLLGALDLLDAGLISVLGSVDDKGFPTLRVTGAGAAARGDRLDRALRALGVHTSMASQGTLRICAGNCPITAATLRLVHDEFEGFVLDARLPCQAIAVRDLRLPNAQGAVAWARLPQEPAGDSLRRRLERFGWRVRTCGPQSPIASSRSRLLTEPPALVIAYEMTASLPALTTEWLDLPYPAATTRVLCTPLGNPIFEQVPVGWRVLAFPLSPWEIALLTAAQEPAFDVDTLSDPLRDAQPMRKLLIVDDNPVNQAVMSAMAEAMGYEPVQADDGLQAVHICEQEAPAAVLMDVNMPGMDGIEATRRIRDGQRAGRIAPFPILGASADATDANRTASLAAGMDTFLAKPLLIQDVAAQLRRLCLDPPRQAPW
ncbi:response regulator [Aquincola tertiaricarbonis]|uniref:response regulator n=1 Tax=Aquincola tertiaricarbonis TaxID=391953 RepID=UPI000614B986|nr:response regulator [Aquincola tertiaricarbonis]